MNKRVLIAAGVVAALGVQGALALFFLTRGDADPADEAGSDAAEVVSQRAIYHNLRPPFVVTLPYGSRQFMLQADLAVMAHDPVAIESVIRHGPLIRAEIISYLTDLDPPRIQSKDGKQDMLDGLTALINGALEGQSATSSVEAVLFNNLVMQ